MSAELAEGFAGEAAVDALKRGRLVRVGATAMAAVELADAEVVAALAANAPGTGARPGLLITGQRAMVLKIANQKAAATGDPEPVWLDWPAWLDLAGVRAVADPVLDLALPMKGPFRARPLAGAALADARGGVALAKHAGLLPALLAGPAAGVKVAVGLSCAVALALPERAVDLRVTARARLPIAAAEDCEVVAFRAADGGPEHLALLIGQPDLTAGPVLARLHSACLTGDVLGSLKCDCGPQLQAALAAIAANPGGGVLLYVQQEGRGIGLLNKLRAYALQDQGFDTVDANERLGFAADERDFRLAGAMLRALGVRAVELMTNNPDKLATLAALGFAVTRRPHALPPNPHNLRYLATKRDRQGHGFD